MIGGWMGGWMVDRWMGPWMVMYGWINSMWSIGTVEYYTAMKRSEALTQATA